MRKQKMIEADSLSELLIDVSGVPENLQTVPSAATRVSTTKPEPSLSTNGDVWFDPSDGSMYIFATNDWIQVGGSLKT